MHSSGGAESDRRFSKGFTGSLCLSGFPSPPSRSGGKVTTLSQAWHWAAAAVILGAALPVMCGDVLLASNGATALGLIAGMLP
jgi:hypothetical protein